MYAESLIKPDFEVSENAIKIVLPVFESNVHLTEDEKVIYKFLSKTMLKPISEIAPYVPFGKSKTTHLLKTMEEKGCKSPPHAAAEPAPSRHMGHPA